MNTRFKKKHGLYGHPLYHVWQSMKDRCNNPNNQRFQRYGKRGITYQHSWKYFEEFHRDMANTYQMGLALDRRDNDKCYTKENCRWVTTTENNRNKSNTIRLSYDGRSYTMKELSEAFNIGYGTVRKRYRIGWTAAQIVETPLRIW